MFKFKKKKMLEKSDGIEKRFEQKRVSEVPQYWK